jgi:ubiquinone/menaquinone biosynthesis C-methylase UbiE
MKPRLFLPIVIVFSLIQGCRMDADWRKDEKVNNAIQPPELVMNIVGIKEGMVVGEFGAGYGRWTIFLATRVGEKGCVYANDIEKSSLKFLEKRCQDEGLKNVRTILGKYEDPLFLKESLDLAFSSLVYHEIENPVAFLKNLVPSLKPNAPIIIIDNDPTKNTEKSNIGRDWEKEFDDAGLEITKKEFLPERDVIFILKVKTN